MVAFRRRGVRCGSHFLFAFQRLVKLCIAAYPARFSLNVCIDRRSFCAYLGYFIAFVPFLVCGSDMAAFALCFTIRFYDHRGLLMASAATAMQFCRRRYKHRRLSSAACTVLHTHAIYRRVVAVLFLRRFLTCFACFMRTITGKTVFR